MLRDKFRKVLEGKSRGEILFAILCAAGIVWLLYAVCLFIRLNIPLT